MAHRSPSRTASWRHVTVLLPVVLVLTLLSGALGQPANAAAAEPRLLPQLRAAAAAHPDTTFRVIVTRNATGRQADARVAALGGEKGRDIQAEAFVATVKGRQLAVLASDPSVKYVSPDAEMIKAAVVDASRLGTVYPQVVKASGLWSGTAPITGAGVGVAVVDTGIVNSPDWSSATGTNRLVAKVLYNAALEKTQDGHGHGTHIAGIIAGNSAARTDPLLKGKYIGIAPEAKLINVRVADETGKSYVSDVVNAIDWVIANRTTYNIRVMNLSLISSVAESATTSVLAAAVERAWFNGIFVVVAAGNAGPGSMAYPPANDPFVVTVGAVDPLDTVTQTDDTLAPWSSYGTTQDGHAKPEVVAPGRYMVSLGAGSASTLAQQYPDRLVDGAYLRMSGTSMAAPVVAGIAALAFQAHPEWTNDQVKWLLMQTATKLGTVAGQGAGEVDAQAVVRYMGTPGFANQGLTINQQLIVPNGGVTYGSASWSTASWSTASWSTASWSTASWSTASWSTANWSTASWSNATESDPQ